MPLPRWTRNPLPTPLFLVQVQIRGLHQSPGHPMEAHLPLKIAIIKNRLEWANKKSKYNEFLINLLNYNGTCVWCETGFDTCTVSGYKKGNQLLSRNNCFKKKFQNSYPSFHCLCVPSYYCEWYIFLCYSYNVKVIQLQYLWICNVLMFIITRYICTMKVHRWILICISAVTTYLSFSFNQVRNKQNASKDYITVWKVTSNWIPNFNLSRKKNENPLNFLKAHVNFVSNLFSCIQQQWTTTRKVLQYLTTILSEVPNYEDLHYKKL